MIKPYRQVAIVECGEPLLPLLPDQFALVRPHPYVALGAPYGDKSPFSVRQSVLERLVTAQANLQTQQPGWRIQIFDAYRPIAVQQFMVDYTFQQVVQEQGLVTASLTDSRRQALLEQVYEFWAVPSPDPAMPPPHSTGAALDVRLIDTNGVVVDMGGEVDELSPRSYPHYFATSTAPQEQTYHRHRQVLWESMAQAGFQQHPQEWWHFSWGDQMWAWLTSQANPTQSVIARYGAIA